MAQVALPAGALLLGSVPLSSTEEVFTRLLKDLPGRLKYLPDGETGDRYNYIRWEIERFPIETRELYLGGTPLPEGHSGVFSQDDIKPSHYDQVAIESYQKFKELKQKGTIPPEVRFQVCLPAPLACVQGHLRAEFQAQIEPLYEKRMYDALQNIIDTIPAEELAIQIDLCFEIIALEYDRGRMTNPFFKPYWSPVRQGLVDRVQRMCAIVPTNVPLGLHLCYGDLRHKHFIEPDNLGLCVEFSNELVKAIRPHKVHWLHMPVPKNREDEDYFLPLKSLETDSETELYLGLVHTDDEQGTLRKIKSAQSVIKDFGVSSECGIGRTPREELDSILQVTRNVCRPLITAA